MSRLDSRIALGAALMLVVAGCAPGDLADPVDPATPAPKPPDSERTSPAPAEPNDDPDLDAATLRAPEGDQYQAFVVAAPTGASCEPFAEQRAQGQPSVDAIEYEVTIPGVQPITQEWWGAQPVAAFEGDDYNPWYIDLDAWLLADEVSAGDPSPGVGWIPDANGQEPGADDDAQWMLLAGEGPLAAPGAGECAYVQPIPEISGAVWLIIEGADWGSIEDEDLEIDQEMDEVMTWVYLGDAD